VEPVLNFAIKVGDHRHRAKPKQKRAEFSAAGCVFNGDVKKLANRVEKLITFVIIAHYQYGTLRRNGTFSELDRIDTAISDQDGSEMFHNPSGWLFDKTIYDEVTVGQHGFGG
jgi:hypothetical protein